MAATKLSIVHFNDVYRVSPQKISTQETISVTQFASLLDSVRDTWPERPDGKKDGLVLFSGDLFAPSVESSVTRGSHMVPHPEQPCSLNQSQEITTLTSVSASDLFFERSLTSHEGYLHLTKLIKDTKFPWLLSNIIDTSTSRVPEYLNEFYVFERAGVRVGIIGLVEEDWIATCPSWPANFEYRDMAEVGMKLSEKLRDPEGQHKCDIIVALTHARLPNDMSLAKSLFALSPASQEERHVSAFHGVDVVLGGHDHIYFVSKGVTLWEGYDTTQRVLGAEDDEGEVLVVKSGCDFQDFSEIVLELVSNPAGSIRRKSVQKIRGIRHTTRANSKTSRSMANLLDSLLSHVSSTLRAPVCKIGKPIDFRSKVIRTAESAAGNWIADILRHAYDDSLCLKGCGGADGVFIAAGSLRSDAIYGPGNITIGDLLAILPFEDPLIVLELDGETLWAALEASLSKWPAQEGRFPVISGFRVSWDSRRPPGHRVQGVWLLKEHSETDTGSQSGESVFDSDDDEEITREKGGRKYEIVTREYMAQGHDGYKALMGSTCRIPAEEGQLMSTIVRKYLLGARFVKRMSRLATQGHEKGQLHSDTWGTITRERSRQERSRLSFGAGSEPKRRWKRAMTLIESSGHYRDRLGVTSREHMSEVDCFDGERARTGKNSGSVTSEDDDLLEVNPSVDGRLKDEGQA